MPWVLGVFFATRSRSIRRERPSGSESRSETSGSASGIEQRRLAHQIEDEFGRDCRLVSISSPEILVLLNKTNPNRYLFIASGIDNLIDATEAGGFEGWLRRLEAHDTPVIALGPITGRRAQMVMDWLNSHYEERKVGSWTLFVKSSGGARCHPTIPPMSAP